ncbi:hypothetical protein F2Q70_00031379 [Brassica cretica]|uniref:RNase H type-1 domain-containing protein n=1 Tax=Brassica cretica TaxID=69181 RepID=A0A8S9FF71_BRACR|nr:hypothetical protein F2Q70_00031379 [Brassica cretica]
MNYLFWRKNDILEPDQDKDHYPWIIWYIWKVRNDKLFRGIDRDPLELIRYAEIECQAWFNTNEMIPPVVQANNNDKNQVLSLGNICMLDGSWTASDRFSGCGCIAFGGRSTAMGYEEYASTLAMPELWNRLQGADCNDKGTLEVAKLRNRIGENRDVADLFPGLQNHPCVTRAQPFF